MKKVIWLLGIVLFIAKVVVAQQIYFRNYSAIDGLCSNTIWCISQDDQGYMWFGTKNGLSRFDGYKFKSYQFNKNIAGSIGNNFIRAICRFDAKTYWIGTEGGLYILDLEKETFRTFKPILHQYIYDVIKTRDGRFWVGTAHKGVYCYNPVNKSLKNYTANKLGIVLSNDVRKLAEDNDGNIWIGTLGNGVKVLNPRSGRVTTYNAQNSNLSSDFVLTVYNDLKGNIWVGTLKGGLNVLYKGASTFKSYRKAGANSLNDDIVRVIYQCTPDKLYIGTEKGLNILDIAANRFESYTTKSNDPLSISDNAVYTIYRDSQGIFWIGTYFGGVNYFQGKKENFELYYPTGETNSLTGKAVSCFLEDKPGKFWVGTEDGGLNYFDANNKTFKSFPFASKQEKLSYHNVHALFKDSKGNLWIGLFTGGLNIYNPETGKIRRYKRVQGDTSSLTNNTIYDIYEDKRHTIWIGTVHGVDVYNPASNKFVGVHSMNLDNTITYDIYEDNFNNIWFATYDFGLIGYNRKTRKWINYRASNTKNSLSSDKLICMLDDHSGNIWIGTDGGGLNKFNIQTRTFKSYNERHGIAANIVFGILQDDAGMIWFSTNNGIYKLNPQTDAVSHYSNGDNLQSVVFNYKASLKASDGKMFFGGIKGFNTFYPDSIHDVKLSYKVNLTNFQLFNKDVAINTPGSPLTRPINYTKEIELSYDQSVISFEYAALGYTTPEKIQYAYLMEGFDKKWNYVGAQRKATYTNLPPGSYTFKVKAGDDFEISNGRVTAINVVINPPFYKTGLAYFLYVILLSGAGWGSYRYFKQQLIKKNQIRLERLKSKREQEFYTQKIEIFTAMAHEIRTPLSLIIAPLEKLLKVNKWQPEEKEQLRIMDENSNRLLDLVNQLLDFRRIESDIYHIHKEEVEIVSLVQTIYSRFSAISYQRKIKFSLTTRINQLHAQADPEALTKILNNLLINAFKFTRTHVKIKVNEPVVEPGDKHFFSISIEDDGIGIPQKHIDDIFTKFFKVSSGQHHYNNLGGTGIGLTLSKLLTEKHDGRLLINSNEGEFTIFTILIPYEPINDAADIKPPIVHQDVAAEVEDNDERPVVLVVEDDVSLISFIVNALKEEGYKSIQAGNGVEALKLLENNAVDIIISDVMMPEMDGLEFCRNVKSDINYSHIPLILLTAKSNSESEIAGIENGADSYIIKPFKWKHVSAVVKNLLSSRDKLRNKFSQQPLADANSLTTNSSDKKFLEKIIAIIEERITDPQLSVEELSREMAMSRSSLHKKLKSMSGHVPNEFIRLIRLKHAARLLLSNEYNVSEIGYMVGFNSHSYFSKCFYQHFKLTPTEFLEKNVIKSI